MSIKSVLNRTQPKPTIGFPKLMQSRYIELIVLFLDPSRGVVLTDDGFGEVSGSWEISSFVDYEGTITLSNE